MKIEDLIKGKTQKIVLISLVVNLAILSFLVGIFDFTSSVLYLIAGLIVVNVIKYKKITIEKFFILGVAVPILYNGVGFIFGWFDISIMFMITATLQQGLVTSIIAKMGGVK